MANNVDENSSFSWTRTILTYFFWFGLSCLLSAGGIYVAAIAGLIATPTIGVALIASALISAAILGGVSIASACSKYLYSVNLPITPTKVAGIEGDSADSITEGNKNASPKATLSRPLRKLSDDGPGTVTATDIYTLKTKAVELPSSPPKPVSKPASPRKGTLKLDEEQACHFSHFRTQEADDTAKYEASTTPGQQMHPPELPTVTKSSGVTVRVEKGGLSCSISTPTSELSSQDSMVTVTLADERGTSEVLAEEDSDLEHTGPLHSAEAAVAEAACSEPLSDEGSGTRSQSSEFLEPSEAPFDIEAAIRDITAHQAEIIASVTMNLSPPPRIHYSTALVNKYRKDQARRELQPLPSGIEQAPNDLDPTTPERELWRIRAEAEEKNNKQRYRQVADVTPSKEELAVDRALQRRLDKHYRSTQARIASLQDESQITKVINEYTEWVETIFADMEDNLAKVSLDRRHPSTVDEHEDENYKMYQHPHLFAAESYRSTRAEAPSPPSPPTPEGLSSPDLRGRRVSYETLIAYFRRLDRLDATTSSRKSLFPKESRQLAQDPVKATCSEIFEDEGSAELTDRNSQGVSSNRDQAHLSSSEVFVEDEALVEELSLSTKGSHVGHVQVEKSSDTLPLAESCYGSSEVLSEEVDEASKTPENPCSPLPMSCR